MTVDVFLTLLFIFSVVTSLVTEAIKKLMKAETHPSMNIVALVVAIIVGCGGSFMYLDMTGVEVTMTLAIYCIIMGLASAVCAMVGYDKCKQAVEQIVANSMKSKE